MSACDPAHCGKAKTGSSGPRGEERIEDAREILFVDPTAVVRHVNYRFIFQIFGAIILRSSDANLNLTIAVRRLDCVDDQVKHGVFNLPWVDGDGYGICGRLEFDADAAATSGCVGQLRAR